MSVNREGAFRNGSRFVRKGQTVTAFGNLIALAALLFTIAPQAQAQNLFGTLVGDVTDSSSAAIAGASVKIVDENTGLTREAVTNDRGQYNFENLPAGTYRTTVTMQGFKSEVKSGIQVTFDAIARADVHLQVGDVTEMLEVTANAVALKTDRADTSAVVSSSDYRDLPVAPGRDYENLLQTIPGVTNISGPQTVENIPSSPSGGFNINGQPGYTRATTIDGAAEIQPWINTGPVSYVPTLEAVEQVEVTTGSFDANAGGAAGGTVALTIKSGTNSLHGSAFEDFTNQNLLANPPNAASGFQKPHLVSNLVGGSLGGRIIRNKLFYFVSFQDTIYRSSSSSFYTVPDALMESGNLSASPTPIYDPATGTSNGKGRTPFPGNVIPQNRFDPIMAKLMSYYPLPTLPQNGTTNNWFASPPNNKTLAASDVKINWNPTPKLSMYGRLGLVNSTAYIGSPFDGTVVPIPGSSSATTLGSNSESGNVSGLTYSTTGAGTYAFRPNLLLDANFGWTLLTTSITQQGYGTNLGQAFGIRGTNGDAPYQSGWPEFQFSTFPRIGTSDQWMPWQRDDPQYSFNPNLTWIKGSHTLKFGAQLVRQDLNHVQAEYTAGTAYGAQGGFAFSGTLTTLNGGPAANQWNNMASILLGAVSAEGRNVLTNGILKLRQNFWSVYGGDQWQVSPKLTLNYGVRWEYYPILNRGDGLGVQTYNFTDNTINLCGVGGIPMDCGIPAGSDWSPRVGLAYRFTQSFVFRAGYSRAEDPSPLVRDFRGAYPYLVSEYLTSGSNTASVYVPVGTVSQGIPDVPVPATTPSNGVLPLPSTVGFVTVLPDFRRGSFQSWNATLEKQVATDTIISLAYVATRANGLHTTLDYNSTPLGCNSSCQPLYQAFGRTNTMPVEASIGNSHYDSLQLKGTRRFKGNYSVNAWFVWARLIGQQTGYGGLATAGSYGNLYEGPFTDPPPFETNVSFVANLPFGKGQALFNSGILSKLLGGWQVSGVFTQLAGNRFGITGGGTLQSVGGPTNRASWAPGVTQLQVTGKIGNNASWFNPLDFVTTPAGVLGNTSPNLFVGPTTYNLDSRITRQFTLWENLKMDLHAEAFNTSNTPQWGNPNTNINNLSLASDGSIANLNGFSTITGTRTSQRQAGTQRQLQFGLRFSF